MKTITKIFALVLLSCAVLFDLPAMAQDFPYPGDLSPIWSTGGGQTVDCGNLQDPDQKTSPIWYKVSGKIAQPQQHNKLHDPNNPLKAGSKVKAGDYVDVNFNVNKNIDNRYTLVSYKVKPDGTRVIFDYQSNLYNDQLTSPPVQGNSNQQRVLVPTTCPWEVYWVKGCLVKTFTASLPGETAPELTNGPAGNPYFTGTPSNANPASNMILGYTFGDPAPDMVCDVCPVVVPNSTTCVTPELIEVIDIPNATNPTEKELIFSVINNINSVDNACFQTTDTKTGAIVSTFPEVGDILFTNIFPSHTGNNQPYSFRYDYQLGPHIPMYPVAKKGVPLSQMNNVFNLAPGYVGAFAFDQRNNHNNLDYLIYQSEIVRYKIPIAEWDRLNLLSANDPARAQVCIELSPKHPEPHTSLEPIYCFDLVFNCEVEEPCVEFESASGDVLVQVVDEFENDASNNAIIPLRIFNNSTDPVTSISITHGSPANSFPVAPIIAPTSGPYVNEFTWTAVNDGISTVTFTGGAGTATYQDGAAANFNITVNANDFQFGTGGVLEVVVNTATGSETILVEAAECAIIVPLPVELLTFTGAPSAEGVNLKWVTASEKSNDHFDIERSTDGKNFEKIGDMKGHGTTSAKSDYKFTDKHAHKGLNYYRLRQVDFDGSHEYSNIIKVSSEKGALSLGIKLVPNPCSDQNCSVLLQGVDAAKGLVVEMKDLTGRVVFSQVVAADQSSFNLPKANLGKGIYILSAKNGQDVTYQKVIIQ